MTKESKLKSHLMKEAAARIACSITVSTPQERSSIKKQLMQEAIDRIYKSGMAGQIGDRSLHTAVWNLEWSYPEVGEKAEAIKNAIEENFAPYMKSKIRVPGQPHTTGPRQHPMYGGLYMVRSVDSGDPLTLGGEGVFGGDQPLATMVMRFQFKRRILPVNNKEAFGKISNAMTDVSQILPGFNMQEFHDDLETSNIPLNPYFHASFNNEERGGAISQDDLNQFISGELNSLRALPGRVDPSNFYGPHQAIMERARAGEKANIGATKSHAANKRFSNKSVDEMPYQSYLLRALAHKVKSGYALNRESLHQEMEELKEREKQNIGLTQTVENPGTLDKRYYDNEQKIIAAFNAGLKGNRTPQSTKATYRMRKVNAEAQKRATDELGDAQVDLDGVVIVPVTDTERAAKMQALFEKHKKNILRENQSPGQPKSIIYSPEDDYHWGLVKNNDYIEYYVGLPTQGGGRNRHSDLTTENLRLMLKHCTISYSEYKGYAEEQLPQVYLDGRYNLVDPTSGVGKEIGVASVIAKYDQIEANEFLVLKHSMVYSANGLDTDPVLNETSVVLPSIKKIPGGAVVYDRDNGNLGRNHLARHWQTGLGEFVRKWGPPAEAACATLSASREAPFGENVQANKAWDITFHNRTNAETVYTDMIQKYGEDWNQFDNNILSRSLSSELEAYYKNAPKLDRSIGSHASLIRLFNSDANNFEEPTDPDQIMQYAEEIADILSADEALQKKFKTSYTKYIASPPEEKQDNAQSLVSSAARMTENNLGDNDLLGAIEAYNDSNRSSRDWLHLAQFMKSRNYIEDKGVVQDTKMTSHDFELFKQYGYQVAKMMDFFSALTYASSGVTTLIYPGGVKGPVEHEIYGRHLSTSSGKGGGGQVMLGLRYAFNSGAITNDTDEGREVKGRLIKEFKRRRDNLGGTLGHYPTNFPYRVTEHGQRLDERIVSINGDPVSVGEFEELPVGGRQTYQLPDNKGGIKELDLQVVKVVERLDYFIGHAGATDGMLKDVAHGNDFEEVRDKFLTKFPSLQDEIGVLIASCNVRLNIIELAAKRAIDKVRRDIENDPGMKQIALEVDFQNSKGGRDIMASDKIDESVSNLENEAGNVREATEGKDGVNVPENLNPVDWLRNLEQPEQEQEQPQPEQPENVIPGQNPVIPGQDIVDPNVPVTPGTQPDTTIPPQEDTDEFGVGLFDDSKKKKPGQLKAKSMPAEPIDFVGKDRSKRSLIRKSPLRGKKRHSSIEERITKVANELDRRGITVLANKLDFILQEVGKNAKENSDI